MSKSVLVYGPPGCGKTTNQDVLAKHFGVRRVLDLEELPPDQVLPEDTLVFTNVPNLAGAIDFHEAMATINAALP